MKITLSHPATRPFIIGAIIVFIAAAAYATAFLSNTNQSASVASLGCYEQSDIDAKILEKAGLLAQASTTAQQITENNQAIVANAALLASTTIRIADLETKILSDYAISLEKAKVDAAEAEVKRLTYLLTALQRQPGTTKPTPAKFVKIQQVTLALAEAKTQRDIILNAYHNIVADNDAKKAELAALKLDHTQYENTAKDLDIKANELNLSLNDINTNIALITTEIANMQANLCPPITVLSPNGGEYWRVGDTVKIKWGSYLMASSSVYIQLEDTRYTNDTAEHYSAIPANATPIANTGEYQWTIPHTLGGGYMILGAGNVYKLLVGNYDGSVYDVSDNYFSIVAGTSTLPINLDATCPTTVFSRDLAIGSQGNDVAALQNFLKAKGYLSIVTTGYFGAQTQVALAAYQASKGISPADGYFGVITRASVNADCATSPSSITIISPNGGEMYHLEDTMHIEWQTFNFTTNRVQVSLAYDYNGAPTKYLLKDGSPYFGYHDWFIPAWAKDIPNPLKIYIKAFGDGVDQGKTIEDYSDNYFTINP